MTVEGPGGLAKLLRILLGQPQPVLDAPMRLSVRKEGDQEHWERQFGDFLCTSRLVVSPLPATALEKLPFPLSPFGFPLAVSPIPHGLRMRLAGIDLVGMRLPLPAFLLPAAEATETIDAEGRIQFQFSAVLPVIGKLLSYKFWVVPV